MLKLTKEDEDYIRENLRYDPETGELWWTKPLGRRRLDKPVGSYTHGYLQVFLPTSEGKRRQLLVHRVAFFLYYGHWPEGLIDHINMVRDDNKIENLRVATYQQNKLNTRSQKGSLSSYKGVYFIKSTGKWRSIVGLNDEFLYFGTYASEEAAARAYDKAIRELHGGFARLNFPEEHEQGAVHGYDI